MNASTVLPSKAGHDPMQLRVEGPQALIRIKSQQCLKFKPQASSAIICPELDGMPP